MNGRKSHSLTAFCVRFSATPLHSVGIYIFTQLQGITVYPGVSLGHVFLSHLMANCGYLIPWDFQQTRIRAALYHVHV